MNKFIRFITLILATIVVLLGVLDLLYTTIYLQSSNRGKIGYIVNSKPKEFDVVILGSSRANNHFVSQMFADKNLVVFNFGMQGSKLFESDLVLKLLLEKKNKIKNVIIDVDVTLRTNNTSEATYLKFLPYLFHSKVIKEHLKSVSSFNYLYYIPFYRYLKYEEKIGIREVVSCGLNIKSKELDNLGYNALVTNGTLRSEDLNLDPKRNKYYEEIKKICKRNNINLIALMTPMCSKAKGMNYFNKVKKLYPEIHNYENVVEGDQFFSSCGHMNDKGARLFTARIIKDFLTYSKSEIKIR